MTITEKEIKKLARIYNESYYDAQTIVKVCTALDDSGQLEKDVKFEADKQKNMAAHYARLKRILG